MEWGGILFTIKSGSFLVTIALVLSRCFYALIPEFDHMGGVVSSFYGKPIRGLLTASVFAVLAFASTLGLHAGELKAEAEDPSCVWSTNFTVGDLDGGVWDSVVFDDGSGPALYVGGSFLRASGLEVNHVARWDGESWSALAGSTDVGVNEEVRALGVFDDGSGPALYVGGDFTEAGGAAAAHVARWDGSAWTTLTGASGSGTSGPVWSLTTFDDGDGNGLYVGGDFDDAGGIEVKHIGRWSGTEWSALTGTTGTGTNDVVHKMITWDDGSGTSLFLGGRFSWAGGTPMARIAEWDGTDWIALTGSSGSGTGSWVEDLAVYDDGTGSALFAGGHFTTAGGVAANHVAKWDGTEWSALVGPGGNGADNTVWSLGVFQGRLIAGGRLDTAGGVTASGIASWDGSSWAGMSGPSGVGIEGTVDALVVYDDGSGDGLYASGSLFLAGGRYANNIARWDGEKWSSLGDPAGDAVNRSVKALVTWNDGGGEILVAGGQFGGAGDITAKNIAAWNGSQWSAFSGAAGEGTDGMVEAIAVYDDGSGSALYVGGWFDHAGGVEVNGIAKWDGSEWSALTGPGGTGVDGNSVRALAVFDDGTGPALYAGGSFSTAGGTTVNNIARWDGDGWARLIGPSGIGTTSAVEALAVFDDGDGASLFAAGQFTTAGGITVNYVASWDGEEWHPVGNPADPGFSYSVETLAVYDDGSGASLYAGGQFAWAGKDSTSPDVVNHIARWDGGLWTALDDGVAIGTPGAVYTLAAYDNNGSSLLIVGASTSTIGSVPAKNLGSWDGTSWSTLDGPHGEGVNYRPVTATSYDDGDGNALFVGGGFKTAGGVPSLAIGQWMCSSSQPTLIFESGFETGQLDDWSAVVPPPGP